MKNNKEVKLKILILGINGFIGSNLAEWILKNTKWQIYGIDLSKNKLQPIIGYPNLHFMEGDINTNTKWINATLKKCDVILPLAAIANPIQYVQNPLKVFELDFESNLKIRKLCVKYNKRLIFPSTSEVYGMNNDIPFKEEESNCILGPINKQRWIYSCSKQLLDRVIYAYGNEDKLNYTIFRPFNWIGPKLDYLSKDTKCSSRVVVQFINDIFYHKKIRLVRGGFQKRSFTYIEDGIEALIQIIENKNNKVNKCIINIGNPKNNISIQDLAYLIIDLIRKYPKYEHYAKNIKIDNVDYEECYGLGYQDLEIRVPSIENAIKYLDWVPKTDIKLALIKTLEYYFSQLDSKL